MQNYIFHSQLWLHSQDFQLWILYFTLWITTFKLQIEKTCLKELWQTILVILFWMKREFTTYPWDFAKLIHYTTWQVSQFYFHRDKRHPLTKRNYPNNRNRHHDSFQNNNQLNDWMLFSFSSHQISNQRTNWKGEVMQKRLGWDRFGNCQNGVCKHSVYWLVITPT